MINLQKALYTISCLFPRSKKLWVFVGWHVGSEMEVFADNTKYLFLHISNNKKNLEAVWLAKDRKLAAVLRSHGYKSYYRRSLLGIWFALRAGTTVIDAYLQPENFIWAGRTRLIQLLHGKGMKRGGYAQKPLLKQRYIFSTSPFVSSMLPKVFVEATPTITTGYSRDDILYRKIPGSEIGVHLPTLKILKDGGYEKKLLYAPTFRRGQKKLDLEKNLDLPKISEWLLKHNFLMAINLHPKYREQAREMLYPNIHFVEDSDVYPLFPFFDVLINDYSSIFTDFLLLDRPIVFYPYDLEAYKEKEGLTFDNYDEYTPGPKAHKPSELIKTLEAVLAEDTYFDFRKRIRDKYHVYQDGLSSERILSFLEKNEGSV